MGRREDGRSLTPKHVRLNAFEPDRRRWEDLAADMAHWSDVARMWFRLRYVGERGAYLHAAWRQLWAVVEPQAREEDWPYGRTCRMVSLCLEEMLQDGPCRGCGGRGCAKCAMTGTERLSQTVKAMRVGVGQPEWSRRWEGRYRALVEEVMRWDRGIGRWVDRRAE